jgi:hypothetical protein
MGSCESSDHNPKIDKFYESELDLERKFWNDFKEENSETFSSKNRISYSFKIVFWNGNLVETKKAIKRENDQWYIMNNEGLFEITTKENAFEGRSVRMLDTGNLEKNRKLCRNLNGFSNIYGTSFSDEDSVYKTLSLLSENTDLAFSSSIQNT